MLLHWPEIHGLNELLFFTEQKEEQICFSGLELKANLLFGDIERIADVMIAQ